MLFIPLGQTSSIAFPFSRLHNEPFWKLIPQPEKEVSSATINIITSASQLRTLALGASLCKLWSQTSKLAQEFPMTFLAIFRMKNESEYKAIDTVACMFRNWNQSYNDITISFEHEKAYGLKMLAIAHRDLKALGGMLDANIFA
ncbi:MAG: hypothetical protein WC156_15325 [Pedobacter sp.]